MDAKFTTKSQEALSAAAMNASTAGNPQIEPAHLLKALMDQRESVAVAVLKAAGADPDAVSTAASSAIRRLPSTQGSTVAQPQFSRAALQVVQNARTQAEQRSDEFVSTEHLLLGVAADPGEAGEALRRRSPVGPGAGRRRRGRPERRRARPVPRRRPRRLARLTPHPDEPCERALTAGRRGPSRRVRSHAHGRGGPSVDLRG